MPGIDFSLLRNEISMAQVLDLLDYTPLRRIGDQLRGPCPVHGSNSSRSRVFSANLSKNAYRCFRCGSTGNQLDLWMAVRSVTVYVAAVDLSERLGVQIPWIETR